ncbi:hypothetical protein Hypma_005978 [Hypsizygus marmoreus]|uniref:Uncharacterized protein n=1 Tax=Hypsizygus marmoreus TaxID=39966 RepID=A0A369KGJ5_HYPMA|nr:hypothetical protein Hypma_005978 [Hypsizygus marmoreus]
MPIGKTAISIVIVKEVPWRTAFTAKGSGTHVENSEPFTVSLFHRFTSPDEKMTGDWVNTIMPKTRIHHGLEANLRNALCNIQSVPRVSVSIVAVIQKSLNKMPLWRSCLRSHRRPYGASFHFLGYAHGLSTKKVTSLAKRTPLYLYGRLSFRICRLVYDLAAITRLRGSSGTSCKCQQSDQCTTQKIRKKKGGFRPYGLCGMWLTFKRSCRCGLCKYGNCDGSIQGIYSPMLPRHCEMEDAPAKEPALERKTITASVKRDLLNMAGMRKRQGVHGVYILRDPEVNNDRPRIA